MIASQPAPISISTIAASSSLQNSSSSVAVASSSAIALGLSTFNHPSGLYSFSYPDNVTVDPNQYAIVGSKGGFSLIPKGMNPDNVAIPGDVNARKYVGVSIQIKQSTTTTAVTEILVDANHAILNSLQVGAGYKKSDFGNISGFDTKLYDASVPNEGRDIYVVDLGNYNGTGLSLLIIGSYGNMPSVQLNKSAMEKIIGSLNINKDKVRYYLQNYSSIKASGTDVSNVSALLNAESQAQMAADRVNSFSNEYAGFCNESAILSLKTKVAPAQVSCVATTNAYAISLQLSKDYYCVDSSGHNVDDQSQAATSTSCAK